MCCVLAGAVEAVTIIILFLLFWMQQYGTQRISFIFSPVVLCWFLFNFAIGIYNIWKFHPGILGALSPYWIVKYFEIDASNAWRSLSAILLSFTGVEALYADMGHFNRPSIQLSCILVVGPCIIS
jgi:KUP system potassium uptake protein